MQGRVKWFSHDKGYGFLKDEAGVQYYFHALDVQGTDLPRNGTSVTFTPVKNKKGERASKVTLVEEPKVLTPEPVQSNDSRVRCTNCSKLMVPRIVMGPPLGAGHQWTPVPKHSICPYCAGVHAEFPPTDAERFFNAVQWVIAAVILLAIGGRLLGLWRW